MATLLIVLSVALFCSIQADHHEFTHHVVLDPAENYHLNWKYDDKSITFEAHVKTKGYVAFGLSPTGSMMNSDIVVGGIKDGVPYFTDYHTIASAYHTAPMIDKTQSWTLLSGKENNTHTILRFKRKLDTCDMNDMKVTEATTRVIYAWNPEDPTDSTLSYNNYHKSNRGTKSLLLLDRSNIVAPLTSSDIVTYDMLNSNVSVPKDSTTYWCQAFKMPDVKEKMHMIRYAPVVQPGHEGLVHHILVQACRSKIDDKWHGFGNPCHSPNMPNHLKCYHTIIAWAIGGSAFDFPEHAGYPLGTDDSPKWVIMQTHYDNPDGRSDFVDNSGLRIYITPKVRKYDAGLIETGVHVNRNQVIPPFMREFVTPGYCLGSCTSAFLADKKDGIKIFASLLHGHLLARKIRTRLIRNGEETTDNLGRDDNYDFNFQEARFLSKEVTLLPGDVLLTECTYDSTRRSKTTYGGLSTQEEMCLNFLYYYPKLDIAFCATRTAYTNLPKAWADPIKQYGWPAVVAHLEKPTSSQERASFQQVVLDSTVQSRCTGIKTKYKGSRQVEAAPKIIKPLKKTPEKCGPGIFIGK